MNNAHAITKDFEAALCEYTGAPYAVAVNSCTMAIFLAVKFLMNGPFYRKVFFEIPKRTYASVPQSIIHAGGQVKFIDLDWNGAYKFEVSCWSDAPNTIPYIKVDCPLGLNDIWDCARRFTSDMYIPGQSQCVSFHASKILGDSQGGAILHDNPQADAWFRRARFDGRTEGVAPIDDHFHMLGWHCYMSPDVATRLLWKLGSLPKNNEDLPNDDYPDLSKFEIFNTRNEQ